MYIKAEFDNEVTEGAVRYSFTLRAVPAEEGLPIVERQFIIDVPLLETGTTDVWVLNSEVAVGDTPEDGFATFSPVPSK